MLNDLVLKGSALDDLDLPVQVIAGHLGEHSLKNILLLPYLAAII